jgi:hypothetical protein
MERMIAELSAIEPEAIPPNAPKGDSANINPCQVLAETLTVRHGDCQMGWGVIFWEHWTYFIGNGGITGA